MASARKNWRVRTVFEAGFVRVSNASAFRRKVDALAECATFSGNPGCFRDSMKPCAGHPGHAAKPPPTGWLIDYSLSRLATSHRHLNAPTG